MVLKFHGISHFSPTFLKYYDHDCTFSDHSIQRLSKCSETIDVQQLKISHIIIIVIAFIVGPGCEFKGYVPGGNKVMVKKIEAPVAKLEKGLFAGLAGNMGKATAGAQHTTMLLKGFSKLADIAPKLGPALGMFGVAFSVIKGFTDPSPQDILDAANKAIEELTDEVNKRLDEMKAYVNEKTLNLEKDLINREYKALFYFWGKFIYSFQFQPSSKISKFPKITTYEGHKLFLSFCDLGLVGSQKDSALINGDTLVPRFAQESARRVVTFRSAGLYAISMHPRSQGEYNRLYIWTSKEIHPGIEVRNKCSNVNALISFFNSFKSSNSLFSSGNCLKETTKAKVDECQEDAAKDIMAARPKFGIFSDYVQANTMPAVGDIKRIEANLITFRDYVILCLASLSALTATLENEPTRVLDYKRYAQDLNDEIDWAVKYVENAFGIIKRMHTEGKFLKL